MSIDLKEPLLRQVLQILKEHVPDCEVWAFDADNQSKPAQQAIVDTAKSKQ